MLRFSSCVNKKEYDKFIKNYNIVSIMQESNWASVKDNWEHFLCGMYEDKKLVMCCLILKNTTAGNLNLFYIPRGFVGDCENKELVRFFVDNIKSLAKKENAYVIKMDPFFSKSERLYKNMNEDFYINFSNNWKIKHDNLLTCGFKHTGFNLELHDNFQPRFNMAVPLIDKNGNKLSKDDLLKSFKSKFRYYLGNYHTKRGVFFEVSQDENDLKKFVEILNYTEKKKGINLRNLDYFKKIMKAYDKRTYLIFGKVNLDKYLEFLNSNNGKQEEIDLVKSLINDNGSIMTLSSALMIVPNNKGIRVSEYLYAGNNLVLNKLCVSNGVVLEACNISIDNNCDYCNLGGISGHLNDTLSIFKANFNGLVLEFIGEYDLPVKKIYYPIKLFMPVLKKVYKLIKR